MWFAATQRRQAEGGELALQLPHIMATKRHVVHQIERIVTVLGMDPTDLGVGIPLELMHRVVKRLEIGANAIDIQAR
jgi:hypothetical protein